MEILDGIPWGSFISCLVYILM